jgi:hypothetical protein
MSAPAPSRGVQSHVIPLMTALGVEDQVPLRGSYTSGEEPLMLSARPSWRSRRGGTAMTSRVLPVDDQVRVPG